MARKSTTPEPEDGITSESVSAVDTGEAAAAPASMPPSVPPAPAPTTETIPAATPPSFLERLRRNRMGALTAALTVGLVSGLLLAVLVPSKPNLYAVVLLGLMVAAAVGFTVRYLAVDRGIATQAVAFVGTVLGVHLMAVAGTIDGSDSLSILQMIGAEGPGFDDALLAALATPAVSAGGVVAGLIAAIVAGWAPRDAD